MKTMKTTSAVATGRPARRLVGRSVALITAGILLAALTAGPGFGVTDEGAPSSLVGAAGELLQLHNGSYGTLFPEGRAAHADAQVLAVDVIVGGEARRFLVPGTESPWAERSARLIADERAGVSYLLWEARVHGVHPLLKLVAFKGGDWGAVKEIAAGVFADKGEPQLRVTHDSHDDGTGAAERTVLHVSWWEEHFAGKEKRYASLILENGEFVDADAIVNLSGLMAEATEGLPQPSSLDPLIRMQAGPHKDVVVMGFSDPGAGRLVGLQIEVLPQALSRLSDGLRAELDALPPGTGLGAVQEAVERAIAQVEDQFHSVGLELIRQDLLRYLDRLWAGDPGSSLGGKMGGRVIWIGAKIDRTGLQNPGEPELFEILSPEGQSHHIAITLAASWRIPEMGNNPPRLFLSQDGSEALVAWLDDDATAVRYRMTEADGAWSELQTLQLWEGFDQVEAFRLLENKASER